MDRYIKYVDINVVEYIYEHYKYLRDNLKIEDGTDGKIKFDEMVYEYCSDDRNIECMSFKQFLLSQSCVVNGDELKLLVLKNGDKKFVLTNIKYGEHIADLYDACCDKIIETKYIYGIHEFYSLSDSEFFRYLQNNRSDKLEQIQTIYYNHILEQINNINKDPNNLKIITSNEVYSSNIYEYEILIIECPFISQEQKNDLMCKCLDTLNKYEQTKKYVKELSIYLIKECNKVTDEQDILLNSDIIKKCCIMCNKLPSGKLLSFLCKHDYEYFKQIVAELPAEERNNIINNIIFKNKIDIFCEHYKPNKALILYDPKSKIFSVDGFFEKISNLDVLSKCTELQDIYKQFKRENTPKQNEELMNRIISIVLQYDIVTIDNYYCTLSNHYFCKFSGDIEQSLRQLGFDIEKTAKKLKQKIQQQYSYILNSNDIDIKKQCVKIISDFRSIFWLITAPFKNNLMSIIKQYFAGVVLDKVSTDIVVIDNKNIINKTGALRDAINKFDRKEVSVQSVIETFKNEFLKDIFDKNGQNNTNKLTAQEDFVEYLNDKFYTDNGVTNAEVINFVTKSNLGTLLKDELSKVNKTISVIHSNNSLMQFNLMQDEIEEKTNKIENNTKQTRQRSNKTEIGLLQ